MPDEVTGSIDAAPHGTAAPDVPAQNVPPQRATAPAEAAPRSGDRDTGSALRSVYQKTVDEAVPDEMLDLLGKLR